MLKLNTNQMITLNKLALGLNLEQYKEDIVVIDNELSIIDNLYKYRIIRVNGDRWEEEDGEIVEKYIFLYLDNKGILRFMNTGFNGGLVKQNLIESGVTNIDDKSDIDLMLIISNELLKHTTDGKYAWLFVGAYSGKIIETYIYLNYVIKNAKDITVSPEDISQNNFFEDTIAFFEEKDLKCLKLLPTASYVSYVKYYTDSYDCRTKEMFDKLDNICDKRVKTWDDFIKVGKVQRRSNRVSSEYYYTKEGVYRLSDHWGHVGDCLWGLVPTEPRFSLSYDDYASCFNQSMFTHHERLGFCKWSDFKNFECRCLYGPNCRDVEISRFMTNGDRIYIIDEERRLINQLYDSSMGEDFCYYAVIIAK